MSIEQDCRETVVFALMKAKAWTKPQAEEYVSLWLDHRTATQQAESAEAQTKTDESASKRDEILAWLRKEAEKEDYFGRKHIAEKLDGAANLIGRIHPAPDAIKPPAEDGTEYDYCSGRAAGYAEGWNDCRDAMLTAASSAKGK